MKSTSRSRMFKALLGGVILLLVFALTGQALAQGGTWATKAPMLTPLAGSVAGVINGKLYVMGGGACANPGGCTFPPPTAYEVYDPATNIWATTAPMPTPRAFAGAGVINDKLYVVGGCINTDCGSTTNVLEVYDPSSDTWASLAPMATLRSHMFVGAINGKLYVAGGTLGFTNALTTLEVYDPANNTWDTTKRPLPVGQANGTDAVVNGNLHVIGGIDPSFFTGGPLFVGTVQAYDRVTDTWSTKAPMPTVRHNPAAGVVNGVLYVVGGSQGALISANEAYDPLNNTWTTKAPMPTARANLTVGVINNVLYAVGGSNGSVAIGTNEAFTPPVPFAAFAAKVNITLDPLANDDAFQVKATFTLGTGNNSIAPPTEDVHLQVGTFFSTIPAGSFKLDKKGRFKFDGVIDGVALEAKIQPLGGVNYEFKAQGQFAHLTGTVNPVTVGLTIGNDGGSTSVTADIFP